MKLFNQFTILKKNLRDIDYVKKDNVDFWKKECKVHPTKNQYLIYCE